MTSVDEEIAWDLVRTLSGIRRPWTATRHVTHPDHPGLRLDVEPSGAWSATHPVVESAHTLIDLFLPLVTPPDIVVAQLGQGLDGRIATQQGHSHYVTGTEDLTRLHRLRAICDAVVVGAGTVASDDPRLTVRRVEGVNPVRVVLDPEGRLDPGRRVFTDGAAPTLVVRRTGSTSGPEPGGIEAIRLPAPGGTIDPPALVRILRGRGHRRILVEGGGITVSRFLQSGALDRLHLTVAPLIMGSGRPALTLDPIDTLDEALRPPCRRFRLGDDVLFDLDLRSAGR